MKLVLSRFAFIACICALMNPSPSYAFSNAVFFRNAGIVGAGLFSAFDALNRILLFSDLGNQLNSCLDETCKNNTKTQETLNAVGLGFTVAPMIGTVGLLAVYGLRNSCCFSSDEQAVRRVAFVASCLGVAGSSVQLGTAAKGLALSEEIASRSASTTRPPDSGRWIASTILSSASEIVSLLAIFSATLVILCRPL